MQLEESEEQVRLGWFAKARVFLAEVREELKMVVFPTWREVCSMSAIVMLVIFLLASYIYVVDQICHWLLDPLLFHR